MPRNYDKELIESTRPQHELGRFNWKDLLYIASGVLLLSFIIIRLIF